MKRSMFVLVICAMFGIAISSQPEQASSQVEVPRDVVSVPSDELVVPIIEPAFTAVEGEVCIDGSCSPAMSSSGPVASVAQAVAGPVRRVIEKKPVRRVLGRVFSRLRGGC